MSEDLTDKEMRVLGVVVAATEERELCSLSMPPVRDRTWFGVQFRKGFDRLLKDGLIAPSTEYVVTEAGRLAYSKACRAKALK